MSIVDRPRPVRSGPRTEDEFVGGAPDAARLPGVRRGRKRQISITMDADLLVQIDAQAGRLRVSRAGFINMVCARAISAGLSIDAAPEPD